MGLGKFTRAIMPINWSHFLANMFSETYRYATAAVDATSESWKGRALCMSTNSVKTAALSVQNKTPCLPLPPSAFCSTGRRSLDLEYSTDPPYDGIMVLLGGCTWWTDLQGTFLFRRLYPRNEDHISKGFRVLTLACGNLGLC